MTEFTREVRFVKGYDKRDQPKGGAHGMTIAFILRGPLGAIEADVNTGWVHRPLNGPLDPNGGPQNRRREPGVDRRLGDIYPTTAGIHQHSPVKYEDWWHGPDDCKTIGQPCYGNTSYLVADKFFDALVGEGEEAGWAYLEEVYASWFAEALVKP